MPIIPLNTSDIQFEQRDLFLDVRLTTININDSSLRDESGFMQDVIDYTGKKTFNVRTRYNSFLQLVKRGTE
jgi:RNase adaptor protein for sRNA GlmZ degradation